MSTYTKVGGQKKEKLCQLKDPWPYFFSTMFYQAGQTVFLRVRSSEKKEIIAKNCVAPSQCLFGSQSITP